MKVRKYKYRIKFRPSFTAIVAKTMLKHSERIAKNIMKNNILFQWLEAKGQR